MRKLLFLFLAGCSPGTEVVVRISSSELIAPDDFQKLCINVTNPPGTKSIYESQDLVVCPPGASANCFPLPISVDLTPGPMRPNDPVRVEVYALGRDQTCSRSADRAQAITADASVFTFINGQSQTLDFFLYRSCLNVDCSVTDQTCDRDGGCVLLEPSGSRAPDLSSQDLAPQDLALQDLASSGGDAGAVIFGDTDVLAYQDNHNKGTANAAPYSASRDGTVRSISFYIEDLDVATLQVGIYDDVSGHPGRLLTQGTLDHLTPFYAAWYSTAAPPIAVKSGTTYWIAVLAPVDGAADATFNIRYINDGTIPGITEHSQQMDLTALPASWSTGMTYGNTTVSSYASE